MNWMNSPRRASCEAAAPELSLRAWRRRAKDREGPRERGRRRRTRPGRRGRPKAQGGGPRDGRPRSRVGTREAGLRQGERGGNRTLGGGHRRGGRTPPRRVAAAKDRIG